MDRTASTEPQCLYNGAPLPLPIPLLPLCAVQPVQSLSACTWAQGTFFTFLYLCRIPRNCIERGKIFEQKHVWHGIFFDFHYKNISEFLRTQEKFCNVPQI